MVAKVRYNGDTGLKFQLRCHPYALSERVYVDFWSMQCRGRRL